MLLFMIRNCWNPAGTLQSIATIAVIVFILCGALVFQLLEDEELRAKKLREKLVFRGCMRSVLQSAASKLRNRHNSALANHLTTRCFDDSSPDWTFMNAVLFAFSIVTTIGFGHVLPKTFLGQVFCSFYSLIGIPLTMVAIANVGKHISNAILYCEQKFMRTLRQFCARRLKVTASESTEEQPSSRPSGQVLFTIFVAYILLGSALIASWESEMSYHIAVYFSLNSLLTIGFGDYWPKNAEMLFLTLTYLSVGLGITTIAMTLISEYLMKLHYYRRKLQNVRDIVIQLGPNNITVGRLLTFVAEPLGVEQEAIDTLNLDLIVEHETKTHARELWKEAYSDENLTEIAIRQRLIEDRKFPLEDINEDSGEDADSCVVDLTDEALTDEFEQMSKDNCVVNRQTCPSRSSLLIPYIDSSRSASRISDF
uniref:Potassium channel domain-containing protein n=1 Tax=Plectus sambesii TaxID=2011161 RepID=A0A914XST2_9BILA